jgi:hypothetical protein
MEYTAICTETLARNNQNLPLNVCRDDTWILKWLCSQDRLNPQLWRAEKKNKRKRSVFSKVYIRKYFKYLFYQALFGAVFFNCPHVR